jgi:tubulin polyglutamylase TTLL6/13
MHLTNYAINKMSDCFVESEAFLEINKASKRTFTSLFKSLRAKNVDVGTIQKNIKRVAARTTEILSPFIEHGVETVTDGKDIDGLMFQILGYDMMIDEDLKVWLLEINDHPSFNIYLEKENPDGTKISQLSLID